MVWQGSIASQANPTAHEAHRSMAIQEYDNLPFGYLILNFFQCSREPHFPEPYLDL
jgi:hypothetical protein